MLSTYKFKTYFFLMGIITVFSGCLRSRDVTPGVLHMRNISWDSQTLPVVVLGGGIAGLTAAVYCSQANIPCVVIEGPKPGGALGQSHSVRNWPGVLQAPGMNIVNAIKSQALAGGVKIESATVSSVDFNQWPRLITIRDSSGENRYLKALSVIITMGTEPNLLGVPGEAGPDGYWGGGVSNCAVCEGSLFKNKTVAVVGGSDAAIAEADYLSEIAKKVYILVRKDFFRAKDVKAKELVLGKSNVEVLFNTEVSEVAGNGNQVTHLVINNNQTHQQSQLSVDGLFLAIGSRPNTTLFAGQLERDEQGFIVLKHFQESSVQGVYAGGDVSDSEFVQAVTAASDGCKAALQAIKFLKSAGYNAFYEITSDKEHDKESSLRSYEIKEVTSEYDFKALVLESSNPVVLDIFTTWCIPCQKMMPVVQELAAELGGHVSFIKINASSKAFDIHALLKEVSAQPIQSVPTFIMLKNGREHSRFTGSVDKATFKQKIMMAFSKEL